MREPLKLENAFGIWTAKFKIFEPEIKNTSGRLRQYVYACCCLHKNTFAEIYFFSSWLTQWSSNRGGRPTVLCDGTQRQYSQNRQSQTLGLKIGDDSVGTWSRFSKRYLVEDWLWLNAVSWVSKTSTVHLLYFLYWLKRVKRQNYEKFMHEFSLGVARKLWPTSQETKHQFKLLGAHLPSVRRCHISSALHINTLPYS